MNPELKAMIDAGWGSGLRVELATQGKNILKDAFLASIHWRGDELWAGPIQFGSVIRVKSKNPKWVVYAPFAVENPNDQTVPSEAEARAALFAAAKAQIETFFKEQAE